MGRICPNCGSTVEDNAKFCDECGTALPALSQETTQQEVDVALKINMYQNTGTVQNQVNSVPNSAPTYQNTYVNMYSSNTNVQNGSSGTGALAVVALVAGILSIVTFGCFFIPQVVAIVCAILSKKNTGSMNGIAKAGFITGIIGAALCLLLMIIGAFA